MTDTVEHLLIEAGGFDIIAQVEFSIEEASGDGWNEPREPAHAHIENVKLIKRVTKHRWGIPGEPPIKTIHDETIPGEVPEWVYDVLHADDYLQDEMMSSNEPDWDSMPGGHDWLRDRAMGAE